MSLVVSQASHGGRASELALWGAAGMIVLAAHFGAGVYLMRATPDDPADNGPPAAIMIELAAEPEAAKPEEQEQISQEVQDQEEVKTEQLQPVEEPPKPVEQAQVEPQPTPEPIPEPVPEPVEPPPPEPMVEEPQPQPPEPEMTQTIPEPPPEPIVEPKPVEEQPTVALDNVEVPLPAMRPPPPVEKKVEKAEKPAPKKEVKRQKPKQQQPQARKEMAEAKVQAKQSERTAASQTSSGFFSSSVSPAQWKNRVSAKIGRYARSCPVNKTGIDAVVRFTFDNSGNIGSVSLSRSSGERAVDDYALSAVRRSSPIPSPPAGVANYLIQSVRCD